MAPSDWVMGIVNPILKKPLIAHRRMILLLILTKDIQNATK